MEYIRRKAFSIHDEFSCIEMAQQHLTEVVQQLNQIKQQNTDTSAQSLFEKEKPFLWSVANTSFASYIVEQLRVDKYATFSYRGNRYSVPDYLVGEFVDVKIASETLTAYYQDTLLCTHARNYGNHQWVIQLDHYLSTFHKKPSALPQSEAFYQSAPFLRQLYTTHFTESARDFVELLLHCQQHQVGVDRLREAYQHLLKVCPTSVNTEKLVAILGNKPIDQTQKKEQQDQIAIASIKHLQALSNLI
ncbi:Mu transposase domain-containing protein [Chondrinema litorale]|uniref:Mu transposase domain-containing protein n=1 Tax=Chondrinema litorale TaxID=2994555 RepID=UPI00254335AF|nr:hypothetical protein [Chondrinema litorale]UZR99981.1 hypothetical protein OQ292_39050 [Chondrinema litorale]